MHFLFLAEFLLLFLNDYFNLNQIELQPTTATHTYGVPLSAADGARAAAVSGSIKPAGQLLFRLAHAQCVPGCFFPPSVRLGDGHLALVGPTGKLGSYMVKVGFRVCSHIGNYGSPSDGCLPRWGARAPQCKPCTRRV